MRGSVLDLFKSYLDNRKQFVAFGNSESLPQQLGIGVPQGSILGPLLFIVYIDDLPNASSFFEYVLFADDSNIHASDKSKKNLDENVTKELKKLSDWFAHNRLSLNYVKTELMHFSKSSKNDTEPTIEIDGKPIREVTETKFLGVYLDKNISWRKHIGNIITKISLSVSLVEPVVSWTHHS